MQVISPGKLVLPGLITCIGKQLNTADRSGFSMESY